MHSFLKTVSQSFFLEHCVQFQVIQYKKDMTTGKQAQGRTTRVVRTERLGKVTTEERRRDQIFSSLQIRWSSGGT